jgi:SAM-dependent methyltransferase
VDVSGPHFQRGAPVRSSPRPGKPDVALSPGRRARERFASADEYRLEREWRRYEGTAQRDLFRVLRQRFLRRHPPTVAGPVLEVGSGPGRFSALVGDAEHARVLFDLSADALARARVRVSRAADRHPARSTSAVVGDAARMPFTSGAFAGVVALGNVVGFGAETSPTIVNELFRCTGPDGGTLLLELAPGAGEVSAYLHRLPPGAVARLLRSPVRAVATRVRREGFLEIARPAKRHPSGFRRWGAAELDAHLPDRGLAREESVAVAPCLGSDPVRLAAVRQDPVAWANLLALEESIGGDPARQSPASALLVAVRRGAHPRAELSTTLEGRNGRPASLRDA